MLYPMFMMVMLTFLIMLVTVRVRTGSVRRGEVPISYYALMEGDAVPEIVTKTTRQFNNLFQVPVLFYVGGVLYIAMEQSGQFAVNCAWAFVAARIVHSIIHLGYNNVLHRLLAFGFANLCVLAMWVAIVADAN